MADDMDLFGEMTAEEIEAEKQRKEAAEAKKAEAAKAAPVGKSQIVYEVKPWGEETDMAEMEKAVRGIQKEGLEWLGAELQDIAFGLKKLVIICNVLDTVDTEEVQEEIEELDDYVQSVDIASFNKL